jgi:hypothetical protein
MGFDIQQQQQVAEKEDVGIDVHVHGVDDLPMFYREDDGSPEGKEKPVTITIVGAHSRRYRRMEEQLRKRKLRPRNLTGEAIYEDNLEKAVACTIGWQGFFAGEDIYPPSRDNIRRLYAECPWVYEQVLEAMHDHTRFFGNGSKPA